MSRLPPFPGKRKLIDIAATVLRVSGQGERSVCLWPLAPFSVNLRDRIQREMWAGCYEPHIMRALGALLRPGDTVIDIGAHIGYHSYFAAGLVGPRGAVYSFEPDPDSFKRLSRNLSAFPAAHPMNCAVWDENLELAFERSPSSYESGWGTLTRVRDLRRGEHIDVKAVSLDAWAFSEALEALRVIKLDAEGSEPRVVLGAERLLQRFRPTLLTELNGVVLRQAGSSSIIMQELLRRNRYELYRLHYNRLEAIPVPIEFDLADCVAFPEEKAAEYLRRFREFGFCV